MSEKTRRGPNHLSSWTVKEMSYLENNYGKFSAQDTGDTLGRSAGAVRGVARKLGLSTPRPPVWTEEELALIRVNYCKDIDHEIELTAISELIGFVSGFCSLDLTRI